MIRLRQIKVSVTCDQTKTLKKRIAHLLGALEEDIVTYQILKQSIDARKKDNILYIYEVDVEVNNEEFILKRKQGKDCFLAPISKYEVPPSGRDKMLSRPIIVGSGPAGLFAAYLLAENGYAPIVIERGEKVEERVKTVETFFTTGRLNPNSNVQFGEGGAGTFSDGKLNTLVKDKYNRGKKVFDTFVNHGAPKDILYLQKPHIGTDILRGVVKSMREKIISLGGTFYFDSCLTDLLIYNDKITSIVINNKKTIPCDNLILAIGHSARDTFELLYHKSFNMKAKPFAVGVRVQHLQTMIQDSQYSSSLEVELPKASYKLAYTTKEGRGVYSFCMCPGGYVINASSEEGRLVINGMSNYDRDTANANSAIVVSVTPIDFGTEPLAGVNFQRKLEEAAYHLGNGNIPLQLWGDFLKGKVSTSFKSVQPIMKGDYVFANLKEALPEFITDSLEEAMVIFGNKISGFNCNDVILAGVESRTSSPIRIERDECCESNIQGVYPCGEGSGYAGGITTASMDGLKVAEEIIKKYQPWQS